MIRFVTYNIQYAKGRDGIVDVDRIAQEISGADVIALQEVDRYWSRSGNIDQVALLSQHLPEYDWVYGPGVDLHPGDAIVQPGRRRQFGNMLMAKTPILWSRNHLLPKYGSIGPLSIQRTLLEGVIKCGTMVLRVYSVHLTHLTSQTRLKQITTLLKSHRQAEDEGAPISGVLAGMDWQGDVNNQSVPRHAVIMGDFNCQPESQEYTTIVGPVSEYGGRVINPQGLIDAWTLCGHDLHQGCSSDIHGHRARLDYCFLSTALSPHVKSCWLDTVATGSDHLPVWIEMEL